MASVTSVREGLDARLATITGLRHSAFAPGQVNEPHAFVIPDEPAITFDETMARGSDQMHMVIVLLVTKALDRTAQALLDAYLAGSGAQSVKAAIEGDVTLGGAADWTVVTGVPFYGPLEYNGVTYLGARFSVEVNVDGA